VQAWVNHLDGQMSAASVAKVYRLLSSSLRAAVKYKRLAVSPCHGIELPHIPPPDERFLTRGEVDAALHFMREPYRTAAVILVGTGMRFGEMAGLHRSRIDWAAQAIDVHETWDGELIKAYPKGRKKRRVPMPSWVADAILALPGEDRGACKLPHKDRKRCASDLVIRGPLGAPLNAHNMLQRHWADALRRAGLEHARQHDLRHTTASWLAQAGRSMTEIAAVLGHAETAVTARYAHLAGTHMDAVRNVMENAAPDSHAISAPFSDLAVILPSASSADVS
jgi:integrase